MKYIPVLVLLLLTFTATAQKIDSKELYPELKNIPGKYNKITGYFDECINGNCLEGEGVRLMIDKLENQYTVYATLFKGSFSSGGIRFNGKVYKLKLYAQGIKKQLKITSPLNLTDETALKPFYIGEGGYYLGPNKWGYTFKSDWNWDGEVKHVPAVTKAFPDATMHKVYFTKGNISWMDVTLPEKHRFARYTGHTYASGDFQFGKAQLKNGDVYEGFFLRHSFHGPGRLTTSYGKVIQGIWQVDSLIENVVLEFPAVLLEPVLPKPTKFKIADINGLDVNTFRHISTNETHTFEESEFYGEVVNNQATGWGLWKTKFTNQNADSNDDMEGLAYGKWKHNKLDGPGIYYTTAWINTGVYDNGKIVRGNIIRTNNPKLRYPENQLNEIPELDFGKIYLATAPLEGCGSEREFWYDRNYVGPRILNLKEGHYSGGKLSGFYFEDDTAKKRSYELLKFAGYNPYVKFSEDIITQAENSNDLCLDAMSRYKPLFVAEMKKKLATKIAEENWAKSPEGQAHKRQVELANLQYEEKRKKECEAEFAKIGIRGRTYLYHGEPVILQDYDCSKKEYIAWRPWQSSDGYDAPAIKQVRGLTTFLSDNLQPSAKQYQTCDECDGTGKVIEITTTTRTKDLPWGYFSGIETKSIRTTTKEEYKACKKCGGRAVVLK